MGQLAGTAAAPLPFGSGRLPSAAPGSFFVRRARPGVSGESWRFVFCCPIALATALLRICEAPLSALPLSVEGEMAAGREAVSLRVAAMALRGVVRVLSKDLPADGDLGIGRAAVARRRHRARTKR